MQSDNFSVSGSTPNSTFGIGIDFGTSNSAAAVFDGEQVILVQLSEQNSIMPSANYIDRDFTTTIGQEAIDEYIALHHTKLIKPLLNQIDSKGKKVYTSETATLQMKKQLMKMYVK